MQSGRVHRCLHCRLAEPTAQNNTVYSAEWQSLGRVAESGQSGRVGRVAESIGQIGSAFSSEAEAIVQSGIVFRAD